MPKKPQQSYMLDQAAMLLPGYDDKSWPDSEDPEWHEKLDDIKCDIQYAKDMIDKIAADQKTVDECLRRR